MENATYTDADICRWYESGDGQPAISKRISRSQCYVDAVLKRNGIQKRGPGRRAGVPRPDRRVSADLMREIVSLYESGISAYEIERRLPVSKQAALRVIRDAGLPIRYQRKPVGERAVSLYAEGMSAAKIAEKLGVGKKLILMELERAGVTRRKVGREFDEQIVAAYCAGSSALSIGLEFDVAPAFVYTVLRRNNVPTRIPTRKNIPLDMDVVVDLYAKGKSPFAIGEILGVTGGTILKRLSAHGVNIRKWVSRYTHVSPIAGEILVNGTWELAYATILDKWFCGGLIAAWSYEPDRVRLDDGKIYIPDFKVIGQDGSSAYHEIKGRLWDKGATKIAAAREKGHRVVLVRRRYLAPLCAHFEIPIVV